MTEVEKKGISRTAFIVGLIIAILVSSLISTVVSMQWALIQGPQGEQGPKGDKGDQGDTGPQGEQGERGEQGPPYKCPVDVTTALKSDFFSRWGTDRHHVYGYIINWGDETADNVCVKMTWDQGDGKFVYKTYTVGDMLKHEIDYIDVQYHFENYGSFSYYVEWS